jgi:hypothetical protein
MCKGVHAWQHGIMLPVDEAPVGRLCQQYFLQQQLPSLLSDLPNVSCCTNLRFSQAITQIAPPTKAATLAQGMML